MDVAARVYCRSSLTSIPYSTWIPKIDLNQRHGPFSRSTIARQQIPGGYR